MFDIGFAELLVLAVIAMVVVGPERLPGVLRTVGKTVGQARRFMTGLQNQIEQEVKLDELNKKIMAETKDLESTIKQEPSHQTEDAEVPSIAPKRASQEEELPEPPTQAAQTDEESPVDQTANNVDENDDTHRS
jgi:sec-independent protein translocase protein TatB